jgi:DNA polymerase
MDPARRRTEEPPTAEEAPEAGRAVANAGGSLAAVAALADGCRACDLWQRATQTVFGHGPVSASIMLVGEQPGDREDLAGEPFVGPAGRILEQALSRAGIDRERVFVTNVVKHFKWRPSGKRRLHERPDRAEVRACYPWLEAEIALVRPQALVCLGATAATAILGSHIRVSEMAGTPVPSPLAPLAMATLHPSAILRAGAKTAREHAFDRLVGDLRIVARHVIRRRTS